MMKRYENGATHTWNTDDSRPPAPALCTSQTYSTPSCAHICGTLGSVRIHRLPSGLGGDGSITWSLLWPQAGSQQEKWLPGNLKEPPMTTCGHALFILGTNCSEQIPTACSLFPYDETISCLSKVLTSKHQSHWLQNKSGVSYVTGALPGITGYHFMCKETDVILLLSFNGNFKVYSRVCSPKPFASSSNTAAELSLLHPGLERSGPDQLSAQKRSEESNAILFRDPDITPGRDPL